MLDELKKALREDQQDIPTFLKKINCPRCGYQRNFLIEKMADRVMLVEQAPLKEVTDRKCSQCNKGRLVVEIKEYDDENMR